MKRKRNHEGGGIVAGLIEFMLELFLLVVSLLGSDNSDD